MNPYLLVLGLFSMFMMILKRIINNLGLMLAMIAGLVITVTLITSIPLYSEGMSEALLHRNLMDTSDQAQPKSSILLRWFAPEQPPAIRIAQQQSAPAGGGGGGGGDEEGAAPLPTPPVVPEAPEGLGTAIYQRADQYLRQYAESTLGLPRPLYVSYGQTDSLPILFRTDDTRLTGRDFAGYGYVAFIEDFEKHVRMLEGRLPKTTLTPEGDIEGVMATAGMDEIGIDVGDRIILVLEHGDKLVPINVKIVGRWWPEDNTDVYWFYQIDYFNNGVMVPKEAFFEHIVDKYVDAAHEYAWFQLFDAKAIRSDNVNRVLAGLVDLRTRMTTILGSIRMEISPEEILLDYSSRLFFLKILLLVLSAPIVAIVLYYIVISSSMIVDRQRNEIAILKSRGASTLQVVGIYLTEGGLFGVVALVAGPVLGMILAQFIARTYTFLVFADRELLPVHLTNQTYQFAILAIALSVGAMVLPAVAAARHSIVTYKQEIARFTRRRFVLRLVLYLLLGAAVGYGYYLLRERRSVLTLGEAGDVFSDPFLLIIPALFIFVLSLIFLEILPLLIEVLARAGGRFWGVSVLLGLRQIGRMPGQYTRLVLLLILTLSLGTFSASVAQTLDRNYNDRVYYTNGSDLLLVESGEYDELSEEWSFLPVSEHLNAPGIKAVTRVFETKGNAVITGRTRATAAVKIMGIDTSDFAGVAWWRDDFAEENFVALLNRLGADERGAIVDAGFLLRYQLNFGDQVTVRARGKAMDLTIVGFAYFWPTLWPDTDHFFIVNLDYLFDQIGASPYDVWARTEPGIHPQKIVNALTEQGFIVSRFVDTREKEIRLRDDPGRTGIFGILTTGFLISALLTIVGFMLYSFLSFQRRFQQFGILRAIGISISQLISLFIFEQGFLIVLGVAVGTVLGIVTGNVFIPFLQIRAERHGGIPEFIVMTAWSDIGKIYVFFGIVLSVAIPMFIWMLTRMRIHEAIKFGEETG